MFAHENVRKVNKGDSYVTVGFVSREEESILTTDSKDKNMEFSAVE